MPVYSPTYENEEVEANLNYRIYFPNLLKGKDNMLRDSEGQLIRRVYAPTLDDKKVLVHSVYDIYYHNGPAEIIDEAYPKIDVWGHTTPLPRAQLENPLEGTADEYIAWCVAATREQDSEFDPGFAIYPGLPSHEDAIDIVSTQGDNYRNYNLFLNLDVSCISDITNGPGLTYFGFGDGESIDGIQEDNNLEVDTMIMENEAELADLVSLDPSPTSSNYFTIAGGDKTYSVVDLVFDGEY